MLLMIIVFCAFMFPFVVVIINSLKQKRDIIKEPVLLAVYDQRSFV